MTTTPPRSRPAALEAAIEALRDFSDTLYWCTLELAVSDALRAQAPADPDDAPAGIEPAVLLQCGDAAVRELVELMGNVDRLVRVLQ